MKGFLYRDILAVRPLLKLWAVVALCQFIVACCDGVASGFTDLWITVLAVATVLAPLGAEKGKRPWEAYCAPAAGRQSWVNARYVMALLAWGAALALMVLMALVNDEMEEGRLALAVYFSGFLLLYLALALPVCIVKQGWLDSVCILAPVLMMAGVIPLRTNGGWDIWELAAPGGFAVGLTYQPWALLALGGAALALSWPVAGLLYDRCDL